jgi:hypothetical protein
MQYRCLQVFATLIVEIKALCPPKFVRALKHYGSAQHWLKGRQLELQANVTAAGNKA